MPRQETDPIGQETDEEIEGTIAIPPHAYDRVELKAEETDTERHHIPDVVDALSQPTTPCVSRAKVFGRCKPSPIPKTSPPKNQVDCPVRATPLLVIRRLYRHGPILCAERGPLQYEHSSAT